MASAGYSRPQNYSSVRDEDDEALDIRIDSNNQRSTTTSDNTVKALHGQVQEVVGVMKQNIDKILDRDVALNNLANRADELQTSASTYNQTTKRLRNKYWWQNIKTNVCIGGIIVVFILIIILSVALGRKKS